MKRGRNQRRRQGMNVNRALDSNGPEVRIRGTANQIYDKYLALARDASSAGDRVKSENYLQHAEHYFRLIRSMQPAQPAPQEVADTGGEQPSLEDSEGRNDRRPSREARGNGAANDDTTSDSETDSADADRVENGDDRERRRGRRRRPRRQTASADSADDKGEAVRAEAGETKADPAADVTAG